MWHKAKKVSLTAGQTDIKIEFPLPIVACNLMIEYADYYENIQVLSLSILNYHFMLTLILIS
jgi:E3 ubiquitin-protein ligase UBR4